MAKKDNQSLLALGFLNRQKCDFTIDTGVTRSVLRKGIAAEESIRTRSLLSKLETAKDGITVYGKANVTIQLGNLAIQLGNLEFETTVVVADIVDDFILGLDIIKKF